MFMNMNFFLMITNIILVDLSYSITCNIFILKIKVRYGNSEKKLNKRYLSAIELKNQQ